MMAFNKIYDLFSSPITIHVHPELFHFSVGTENLQMETYLNLKKVNEKYTFHSAGGRGSTTSDVVRVHLFQNTELPSGVNRMEALEAFLRYGIQKLPNKSRIIMPVIIVKNIQSLDHVLLGYQQDIMRPILKDAGAREVRFE
jgi:hypothetical protein